MNTGFVEWAAARPGHRRKDRQPPGWVVVENGCHIWTGTRSGSGYGRVWLDGRMQFVHVVRYEREVGPIPGGMELDHYFCSNGAGGCCNPHHCRPAGHRENTLRSDGPTALNAAKTHCQRGHELAGDNLVASKAKVGARECRECARARHRERYRRLKQRAAR